MVRTRALESQEVDEHVVAQVERAVDLRRAPEEHALRGLRLDLFVEHDDAQAAVVLAATASPPGHLDVLAGEQDAVLQPVPLPRVREDHGLGGHVDAHGERLRGEEHLDQRLLEKDLDDLEMFYYNNHGNTNTISTTNIMYTNNNNNDNNDKIQL